MSADPGEKRTDTRQVLDALTRAAVVIIGASTMFVLAFLADWASIHYTHR